MKKMSLKNRKEVVVNGVKVIEPIITYEGSLLGGVVRGDEESLIENRKRIIKKMAEVYQEVQREKTAKQSSEEQKNL